MKHLKTYESHSPLSEIIEYIKDICLELKDEGFNIWDGSARGHAYSELERDRPQDLYLMNIDILKDRWVHGNVRQSNIEINRFRPTGVELYRSYEKFEISDVYETVCTIINYMASNRYKTNVKINSVYDITTSLNDITVVFDAVRNHKAPSTNLNGLGQIRYIKLYFIKK